MSANHIRSHHVTSRNITYSVSVIVFILICLTLSNFSRVRDWNFDIYIRPIGTSFMTDTEGNILTPVPFNPRAADENLDGPPTMTPGRNPIRVVPQPKVTIRVCENKKIGFF